MLLNLKRVSNQVMQRTASVGHVQRRTPVVVLKQPELLLDYIK